MKEAFTFCHLLWKGRYCLEKILI